MNASSVSSDGKRVLPVNETAKKRKKLLKVALSAVAALLAVILCGLTVFSLIQPLLYRDYYKLAEREFTAPGLDHGLVPQGFCYLESEKVFLSCGYMTNGEDASRIYITDELGKNARFVELVTEDGEPYTGHTGGIAASAKKVFLANDGEGEDNCVWVMDLAEVLNEETAKITLKTRFFPETRAACCFVYDGNLWVGEFYDEEKYPTKESHRLTTPSGEENPSLICSYPIDSTKETGISSDIPEKAISVPGKLQGFAFTNGKIVLSTSYGLASSHIYVYSDVTESEPRGEIEVNGVIVPVWYLDSRSLLSDIEAPPMSEELAVKNGRVYILYESACHKYIFGIFMRGRRVYSIEA